MVLDMCCGMGNFFNHLPNPHNAYGFDIDGKAVSVARYLYPEAHIEKCDIRQYYPEQRFDVIIGNPPFNLKFDYKLSQEYYMDKAYDCLLYTSVSYYSRVPNPVPSNVPPCLGTSGKTNLPIPDCHKGHARLMP